MAGAASISWAADGDPPKGFEEMFDGMSLIGWHTEPRVSVPKTAREALAEQAAIADGTAKSSPKGPLAAAQATAKGRWEVNEGVITGGQDERRMKHEPDNEDWGLGSWLMTDETYGNFELRLDAKPDWPCDTGIYVRTTRLGQGFQILLDHRGDDTSGAGGGIGFFYLRGIGGLLINPYNFRWTIGKDGRPKDVHLTPVNETFSGLRYAVGGEGFRKAWHLNDWNNFRIRVVGGALPRITVWINNLLISDCDMSAVQSPGYEPAEVKKLLGKRGHIALEVHDGPPWRWGLGKVCRWRNVFIRPL